MNILIVDDRDDNLYLLESSAQETDMKSILFQMEQMH